ncbi:TIGR02466 family protein [Pseudomonas syringae]|uniref:TIGR02466 family protein n=1 Tax=Pseudomonas syringae TaxID=317 RepID=UPI0009B40F07|nr:TIGR02466 family protein [Pseudomonas syringae]
MVNTSLNVNAIVIDKLFPTPIARIELPNFKDLNEKLSSSIKSRMLVDDGVIHSNNGGWQSKDDFEEWSGAPGNYLMDFAHDFANQLSAVLTNEHGLVESKISWCKNAWANVNLCGDSNTIHGHPSAYWSGVYWVDHGAHGSGEPIGGEIEFLDPRGLVPSMLCPQVRMKVEGCLGAGLSKKIVPKAGTLIMFPSWLLHFVNTYTGETPRISVAFNFSPLALR